MCFQIGFQKRSFRNNISQIGYCETEHAESVVGCN